MRRRDRAANVTTPGRSPHAWTRLDAELLFPNVSSTRFPALLIQLSPESYFARSRTRTQSWGDGNRGVLYWSVYIRTASA